MVKLRCLFRTVLFLMTLIMGLSWIPFGVAWADLNDGLVVHYPFDGNGNVEDRLGNSNGAYLFGNYISISGDLPNTNEPKSGFAWIKTNNPGEIIYDDNVLELSTDSSGIFQATTRGHAPHCQSDIVITDNRWHFIGATYSTHLYVDGVLVKSCGEDVGGSLSDPTLGAYHVNKSNPFSGIIDDFRIYNRVLSESEIKQLYSESDIDGEPCSVAISFSNLKPLYNVGERVVIDLVENLEINRFNRVDLWVVIKIPSGDLLYMTKLAFAPFSLNSQPFRSSLDNTQTTHRVLEFEVLPGLGGDYNFYAAYVEEGKNPMTDSFLVLHSNVAKVKVVLSNE